ncbi:MAG: type III-B CRISPR module RAMP protein Cmr6 [Acidobacteria bacterium]|nr:type III-B CRISPR module RAMP protein Cmr6 [Acidobacteriota bacterium]
MVTRREQLRELSLSGTEYPNAGLWLDKLMVDQSRENKVARRALVTEVASIPEPENYRDFFGLWERSLRERDVRCVVAKVSGRMIVGLGAEGVLEASVALHRTYGVPYIPGSALKGLAASFARHHCGEEWGKGSNFYRVIFGDTEDAGYVTFFDALYVPGSGVKDGSGAARALWPDVMTVHHQEYYQEKPGRGDIHPPADWDDPNPVPFISATGEYLIAVAAPAGCEGWRDRAFEILCKALRHEGVGAKTSSGYGRLETPGAADGHESTPTADEGGRRADELIAHVRALLDRDVPGRIGVYVEQWRRLEAGEEHKRRVAAEIIDRVRRAGREKASRDKDWYKELLAYV